MAGQRSGIRGDVDYVVSRGSYWSSSENVNTDTSWLLNIEDSYTGTYTHSRSAGLSVRCVRDLLPTKDD